MSNQLPDRLANFNIYNAGALLVGVADVEMPSFEAMTDTMAGAGIAGEIDTPTIGHFGSLTMTVNWRSVTKQAIDLMRQEWHALELRGAMQVQNSGTGQIEVHTLRVAVRAMPKNYSLGTAALSSQTDSSSEFELSYIRVDINGALAVEYDKLNFKYIVGGTDTLGAVRAAIS